MPDLPSTSPRLVATDLDGTLLRTDGTLSSRTRAAIAAVEEAGVTTVFVTARPPRWLDDLADAVGEHGVAICGNGAFVYDVRSRAVSEHYCIDADVLRELVADLRDAVPQIAFAVERPDGMGRESAFVYRREASAHSTVGTLEEITGTPVGKLLGRCEEMDPVAFHRQVADVLRGRAELGYSGAVGLAEITAAGVTKAAALARWCSERQIDGRDVWAFGDMPNDLPMLEWAGTSFAVRNAHPDVLSAATYACASNDDDGVALVLETLANVRGPNDVGRR